MGCSQVVRQRTLTPSFRWFESTLPNHPFIQIAANPQVSAGSLLKDENLP